MPRNICLVPGSVLQQLAYLVRQIDLAPALELIPRQGQKTIIRVPQKQ